MLERTLAAEEVLEDVLSAIGTVNKHREFPVRKFLCACQTATHAVTVNVLFFRFGCDLCSPPLQVRALTG